MDDQERATAGAPSAPPMVAPAQPAEPEPVAAKVPARRRRAAKAGTGPRRGPKPMSEAEKAERQKARDLAQQQAAEQERTRADNRRNITRVAAIAAITPHLLEPGEVEGLGRFVLAIMQERPGQAPDQPVQP
jgi:hypothetical protein